MSKSIVAMLVLGCLLAVLPCTADESREVGRLESGTARFHGDEVAAGSILRGDGLLFTGTEAVVLSLANGRRIEVPRSSVLKLVEAADDAVAVTVLQGSLSFEGAGGRRTSLGLGSRIVLHREPSGRASRSDQPDFGDEEKPRR